MISLERAIALVAEAHAGVRDRGGAPYILHPLRVMLAQETNEARIVAVFHDVLEDAPGWDIPRLRAEGFTEPMIEALIALTKKPDEDGSDEGYMRFVKRAAANVTAKKVKAADLRDNLDRSRISTHTEKDMRRWAKYEAALAYLCR